MTRFPQGEYVRMLDKKQVIFRKVQRWFVTAVGAFKPAFRRAIFKSTAAFKALPAAATPARKLGDRGCENDLRLHYQGICARAFFR